MLIDEAGLVRELVAEAAARKMASVFLAETETLEETLLGDPVADDEVTSQEEVPDIDDENSTHTGQKPPEDGLCRNCRQRRKLNRHRLCYPCWVEDEIYLNEKAQGREWKAGDPHPGWCHCVGLGEHQSPDGSSRGFN